MDSTFLKTLRNCYTSPSDSMIKIQACFCRTGKSCGL